jgi:aldose 1-epimerase
MMITNFFKSIAVVYIMQLFAACVFQNANEKQKNTQMNVPTLPPTSGFDTIINGQQVGLYYIQNNKGLKAAITNYGARVVGMLVQDKSNAIRDVVIGFDKLKHFIQSEEPFFGAVVGRYGNRIAKGRFTLDGQNYQLDINNGVNSLHGGRTGFHNRVWKVIDADSSSITLSYLSVDGEEGYPGSVTTSITYSLTEDNELKMEYTITTDKATVVNVTNHNFWNLNGEGSGTINNHQLMIAAEQYLEVDSTLIPTGIVKVENTPFDFRAYHAIGERLSIKNPQLEYGIGYDHNFVLDKGLTNQPELVASVKADQSGIQMDVFTTEPGMQFYGGNVMKGKHTLKSGARDEFQTAFCLETQHFPDSPNQPEFPSTVLTPGSVYKSSTIYKFGISNAN